MSAFQSRRAFPEDRPGPPRPRDRQGRREGTRRAAARTRADAARRADEDDDPGRADAARGAGAVRCRRSRPSRGRTPCRPPRRPWSRRRRCGLPRRRRRRVRGRYRLRAPAAAASSTPAPASGSASVPVSASVPASASGPASSPAASAPAATPPTPVAPAPAPTASAPIGIGAVERIARACRRQPRRLVRTVRRERTGRTLTGRPYRRAALSGAARRYAHFSLIHHGNPSAAGCIPVVSLTLLRCFATVYA